MKSTDSFGLGLGRSWDALRELWDMLSDLSDTLPRFLAALCRAVRNGCRRPRRDGCCIDVPPSMHPRADPFLYSQSWLMSQGLSVTWDNPDIQLFDMAGNHVSPWQLNADTDYQVEVRVWNNSYDGPAAGLPIYLSYLSFGIGTTSHGIDMRHVDLGVKGSAHCPAYRRFVWHTPAVPGHYCLQAYLDWFDDANPLNNLGQKNTQVGKAASPAQFQFEVHNTAGARQRFELEVDMYAIPPLPPCSDQPARQYPSRLAESRARWEEARRTQGYGLFPVTPGWKVTVDPLDFVLTPDESRNVNVSIEPVTPFQGRQAFNIHGFATPPTGPRLLVNGVTLYVEKS